MPVYRVASQRDLDYVMSQIPLSDEYIDNMPLDQFEEEMYEYAVTNGGLTKEEWKHFYDIEVKDE